MAEITEDSLFECLDKEKITVPQNLMPYIVGLEEIYKGIKNSQPETYEQIKKLEAGNIYSESKNNFEFSLYSVCCKVKNINGKWDIKVKSFDNDTYTYPSSHFGKELEKAAKIFNNLCNDISNNKSQEIPHIPDDHDLSVEEIDAYLYSCDLIIGENFSMPEVQQEIRFIRARFKNSYQTKRDFYLILKERLWKFEPYRNVDFKPQYRVKFAIGETLDYLVDNFEEKFDKCMAELHAKENQTKEKSYASAQRDAVKDNKRAAGEDKHTKKDKNLGKSENPR